MKASTNGFSANPVEGEGKIINSELWHACAGPLVSLPPAGSLVVYFPQGHSEQVAASMQRDADSIPSYPSLPSKLICVLHNVTLHADAETDEVYAQMTLQPANKYDNEALLVSEMGLKQNKQPSEFFCKTLTASDTSTHGGFSVPRRAAEKIFPPLDFAMQPPFQELVAKDLHDVSWTFRHIYRGQPKRHLLTTGWSVFVSTKRILAGDSVLFIRDEKSQLLLGIRRADRQQPALSSSVLSSDSMHIGILAAAAHAAANNSSFTIFYNPRTSPSEFVIPLAKYNKAMYTQLSLGMRFRMMFETEESGVRRYMGTITGISDLDPVRWKNSQWRNLQVGWDESTATERRTRVSIWEIEPVATPFYMCPPPFFRPKFPKQPGMPDGPEVENAFKRAMPWLGDDPGMKDAQSPVFSGLSLAQWMAMQQNPQLAASATQSYFPSITASAMQDSLGIDDSARILNFQSHALPLPNLQINRKLNPESQRSDTYQQLPLMGTQQQQNWIHPQQQQPQLQHQAPQQPQRNPVHQQQQQQPQQRPQQNQPRLVNQENSDQQQQKQHQPFGSQPLNQTQLLNQLLQPPLYHVQHQGFQTPNHQLQQCLPSVTNPSSPQPQILQKQQQQLQVQLSQPQLQLQLLQKLQEQQTPSPHLQSQLSQQLSHQNQQFQPKQNFQQQQQTLSSTGLAPQVRQAQQINTNHITGHLRPQLLGVSQSTPTGNYAPSCSTSPSAHTRVSPSKIPSRGHQKAASLTEEVFAPPVDNLLQELQNKPDVRVKRELNYIKEPDQLLDEHAIADHLDASSATSFCLDGSAQEGFALPPLCLDGDMQVNTQNNFLVGASNGNLITNTLLSRGFGSGKDMQNLISHYGNQRDVETEVSTAAISSNSFGVPDLSFNHGCSSDAIVNESGILNRGLWANQPHRMRTYTKVQKRGSVGRSIDVTRYKGYDELRYDLACMFGIEGQLEDSHRTDWKLVYVDHENDILLVGDDPWEEFVNCVQSIKILSAAEVKQMSLDGDLPNIPPQTQACSGSDNGNVWRGYCDDNSGASFHR